MVRLENAADAVQLGMLLIAIQSEAVRGGSGGVEAGAEAVGGEEAIGVVELEHAADHHDRLLVGVELALRVQRGISVMERGGRGGIAVTGGEVNGDHEVEIESVLHVLQEGGLGDECEGADGERTGGEEAMMMSPGARTVGKRQISVGSSGEFYDGGLGVKSLWRRGTLIWPWRTWLPLALYLKTWMRMGRF